MCDEWMPTLRLPMTWEQFRRLPRNPAYSYDYLDGQTLLTPRPKHFHALLDLPPGLPESGPELRLRRVNVEDFAELESLFADAFEHVQPFGGLDGSDLRVAARACLERARNGGDGPWIEQASLVALEAEKGRPVGAILITLLPDGDPSAWDSYYWRGPPPQDCVARRLGRPHLTWIFVARAWAGRGVGMELLAAAAGELVALGYTQLVSTFLLGNDSSLLWHWRSGFRLLPYPGSRRRLTRGNGPTGWSFLDERGPSAPFADPKS